MKSSKNLLKNKNISIRCAQASDYESVSVLEEMIFDIHRQARPDYFKALDQSYSKTEFEGLLASPCAIALVAVCDGVIVGICFGNIEETPENAFCRSRKIAFIQDLVTLPDFRGKGVATALMAGAREQAVKENAASIELCVWNFNEQAIRFYEKMGMDIQYVRMEASLEY